MFRVGLVGMRDMLSFCHVPVAVFLTEFSEWKRFFLFIFNELCSLGERRWKILRASGRPTGVSGVLSPCCFQFLCWEAGSE